MVHVTDLWCHLTYNPRSALWSSRIISEMLPESHTIKILILSNLLFILEIFNSLFDLKVNEMLPEIHTMEKTDFLKSIIHSQNI